MAATIPASPWLPRESTTKGFSQAPPVHLEPIPPGSGQQGGADRQRGIRPVEWRETPRQQHRAQAGQARRGQEGQAGASRSQVLPSLWKGRLPPPSCPGTARAGAAVFRQKQKASVPRLLPADHRACVGGKVSPALHSHPGTSLPGKKGLLPGCYMRSPGESLSNPATPVFSYGEPLGALPKIRESLFRAAFKATWSQTQHRTPEFEGFQGSSGHPTIRLRGGESAEPHNSFPRFPKNPLCRRPTGLHQPPLWSG